MVRISSNGVGKVFADTKMSIGTSVGQKFVGRGFVNGNLNYRQQTPTSADTTYMALGEGGFS